MKTLITIALVGALAACSSNPTKDSNELASNEEDGKKTKRVCETVRTNQTGQRLRRVCKTVVVEES